MVISQMVVAEKPSILLLKLTPKYHVKTHLESTLKKVSVG